MTSYTPVNAFRVLATAMVAAVLCVPGSAEAQSGCRFGEGSGDLRQVTLAGGRTLVYVGTPHLVCSDGVEIWADSAQAWVTDGFSDFIGDVRFVDPVRELESDEARYFTRLGRLQAEGNLVLRDIAQGSVIENGDLVYLRQTDTRDEEQITVRTGIDGIRPTALLYMDAAQDTTDAPGQVAGPRTALRDSSSISVAPVPPPEPDTTPYVVTGNEIFLQGNSYFRSVGDVEIVRDSIHAYGQVAEYDEVAGRILLEQDARVESASYDLVGRTINIGMENGAMRDLRAIRDGVLTGEDLTLTAPYIHIFLTRGTMERLVATPLRLDPDSVSAGAPVDSTLLARPRAVADRFTLIADSLDVRAPGEILERIYAVGTARSESRARDSLNVEVLPEVARSDWLEGDTVIASFIQVQVQDTTVVGGLRDDYRLNQIEARANARSLYRLAPSDSTRRPGVDPPAVHYVLGDAILIALLDGEVDHMDVTGQTRGFHLEPLRPEADSLAQDSVALDSLSLDTLGLDTLPDTTAVGRRGSGGGAGSPPALVRRPGPEALRSRRPDPFHRSRRPW